MSRSGYSDDCSGWDLIRWRGAVNSAIKGKRGQAFLQEMANALDSMPEKRLISDELVSKNGEVCALGAVAKARSLDVSKVDPEDSERIAQVFNVARALACEIESENDPEWRYTNETPEERWTRMRKWVSENLMEKDK